MRWYDVAEWTALHKKIPIRQVLPPHHLITAKFMTIISILPIATVKHELDLSTPIAMET